MQLVPDSFAGLVTTGLYLHDCSLTSLAADVLDPLNATLRYLWLNGNELDRLDRRLADSFSRLNHIRLGSNPLRCGCESVWLKRFYDRHSDAFRGAMAPSCLHPHRLRGRLFSELTLHDLRCQAPTFIALEAHFFDVRSSSPGASSTPDAAAAAAAPVGLRLRCAAVGDPVPTLYWIRPNGKTTRYDRSVGRIGNDVAGYGLNGDDDADANDNEAVLELLSPSGTADDSVVSGGSGADSLAGMYTCIANNEAGNVTMTVAVPLQRQHSSASAAVMHKYLASSTVAAVHRAARPSTSPSPLLQQQHSPPPSALSHHDSSIQSNLLGDSLLHLRRLQLKDAGGKPVSTSSDGADAADPSYRLIDAAAAAGNRSKSADDYDGDSLRRYRQYHRNDDPTIELAAPARFSSSDLAWAVVGTHIATLLLCAVAAVVCRATGCGGIGSRRPAGWLSIYRSSSSQRRNQRKSSAGSTTMSGIGGVAACKALKAAYDRRRLQPQWSASSTHGGGDSKTHRSAEYDACETAIRPAPTAAAAAGESCHSLSGGPTPSAGRRFVANPMVDDDDISETVYLNGVHRFLLPSYTNDVTGSRSGSVHGGTLTSTTYTTIYGKR